MLFTLTPPPPCFHSMPLITVFFYPVNVSTINALFPKGGDVTVADLIAIGAVRDSLPVKVLGNGEIDVKVTVTSHAFSSSAVDKITAAGGKTNVL